jgi:4-hydroxy-2-oxoheptanedioate aldolase
VTTIKQRLARREAVALINIDHPAPSLVASLAGLGIDAVMLDCEQGLPSFSDVEELARAARQAGIGALVRVPSAQPWDIERYLLRGVDGLVIPRLDTATLVAQALEEVRYCRQASFDTTNVIVQIESASAVCELDDILAVPGIDALFIGAVDLSKSMGFRGDYAQPEVLAVIDEVIDRVRAAGRNVGMLVKPADVAHWSGRGVTLLYGHVNDFIRMGAAEWRARASIDSSRDQEGQS